MTLVPDHAGPARGLQQNLQQNLQPANIEDIVDIRAIVPPSGIKHEVRGTKVGQSWAVDKL